MSYLMLKLRWLFALLAMLPALQAPAATPAETLARFVDGTRTLTARFEQLQTDDAGRQIASSTGRLWLERPGRFRWSYETPYEQLLVSDGETIWMYDPDLQQVTLRDADEMLAGTPAALLSRTLALQEGFRVEDLGGEGALQALRLTPKDDQADFESIELWLQGERPERMIFFDTLGGRTDVTFTAVSVNPSIDDELFTFEPPPGVEVVSATPGS